MVIDVASTTGNLNCRNLKSRSFTQLVNIAFILSNHANIYLNAEKARPDFRQVYAFLYSAFHDVDTDGDSFNPASRTWTRLWICNREKNSEWVRIFPVSESPLILEIESDLEFLAARTAYYLATYMQSGVSLASDGPFVDPSSLSNMMGDDFDSKSASRRAAETPFAQSTLENPYPNLPPDEG